MRIVDKNEQLTVNGGAQKSVSQTCKGKRYDYAISHSVKLTGKGWTLVEAKAAFNKNLRYHKQQPQYYNASHSAKFY